MITKGLALCKGARIAILSCIPFFAMAEPAGISAYRLQAGEEVRLDGQLDEPAWKEVPLFDHFFEYTPRDKREAQQRTEVRIAYDDKYLYFALYGFDSKPDAIRDPFARRDKTTTDQDLFALFIDPTGKRKSAQFFWVNVRGAVSDGMYTDENGEDFAPDYAFDAATARQPDGWSAEFRIPFSSLNAYMTDKDWGFMVIRVMPREHLYRFTNGPLPINHVCKLCYGSALKNLHNVQESSGWTVVPQVVARRSTHKSEDSIREQDLQFSMDAKARLDPQTVLDMTINPDFSQVELDAPVLSGNTHFATFFPEKRQFFLESADLLQSSLKAIHTRSITQPIWGARLTRRSEAMDMTVFSSRDEGEGKVLLPGTYSSNFINQDFHSQATLVRLNTRRDSFSLGSTLSDRTLMNSRGYNRVIGPDFSWQPADTTRVHGQLLASSTTAWPDAEGRLARQDERRGYAMLTKAQHEGEHWTLSGQYTDISKHFRADNGFIPKVGIRDVETEISRRFSHAGSWRQTNLFFDSTYTTDHDGKPIYQSLRPGISFFGPRNSLLTLEWRGKEQSRLEPHLPMLERSYMFLYAEASPTQQLGRVSLELDLGEQINYDTGTVGQGGMTTLFTRWQPLNRLEVEQKYSRYWVDGRSAGSRNIAYAESAYQWNSTFHITGRDSIRLIWQRNSISRNLALAALSGAPTLPGWVKGKTLSTVYTHRRDHNTALYLGFTADDSHQSDQMAMSTREVFVKAIWAF